MPRKSFVLGTIIVSFLLCSSIFAGKVIEEVVAKINDDIITKSEFEESERQLTREIYSNYTGAELDEKLKASRDYLLYNLINEKLLFQKAEQQYDLKKLGDSLVKELRDQKNLKTKEEFDKFLKEVRLTEEELKNEILKYQAPQMILNSLVRDKITVGEKEIESHYNENIVQFTSPEKRTVLEIILLATDENREEMRKKGEEALAKLKGGADFATIAAEYSDGATKEKGGLLGTFTKGELASDLEMQAFSLKQGEVSALIETAYGFHIVKVDRLEAEKVRPLEEARFEIYDAISNTKYEQAVDELLTQMWEDSTIEVNDKYKERLNIRHVSQKE